MSELAPVWSDAMQEMRLLAGMDGVKHSPQQQLSYASSLSMLLAQKSACVASLQSLVINFRHKARDYNSHGMV